MTRKLDVLDHGFVRLVSFMQPAEHYDFATDNLADQPNVKWSGDLEVIRNARVSHDADWRTGVNEDKDRNILQFMIEHQHSSPFEAMVFTFEIQAPIFVFRQWHRHRTWSYNELSARYAPVRELYYVPELSHVGTQSLHNKQQRDLTEAPELATAENFVKNVDSTSAMLHDMYQGFIAQGIPRELARIILPLNTYSRMFGTVDLHNLMHFWKLRLSEHAQYEIRVYAQAMVELTRSICVQSIGLFEDANNLHY